MMHPAHEAFASRPTFCRLPEFLALLNAFDVNDRHEILGPLYQQFLKTDSLHIPQAKTDEQGKEFVYQHFRRMIEALAEAVHFAFIVHGLIHTALVWHYGMSDESLVPDFLEGNERSRDAAVSRCERGEITQEELQRELGEIEERVNNMRADMRLRRERYERFCEEVIARLPDGRP